VILTIGAFSGRPQGDVADWGECASPITRSRLDDSPWTTSTASSCGAGGTRCRADYAATARSAMRGKSQSKVLFGDHSVTRRERRRNHQCEFWRRRHGDGNHRSASRHPLPDACAVPAIAWNCRCRSDCCRVRSCLHPRAADGPGFLSTAGSCRVGRVALAGAAGSALVWRFRPARLQRSVSPGDGASGRTRYDCAGVRRNRCTFCGIVEERWGATTGRRGDHRGGLSHRKSGGHTDHVCPRPRPSARCAVGRHVRTPAR